MFASFTGASYELITTIIVLAEPSDFQMALNRELGYVLRLFLGAANP